MSTNKKVEINKSQGKEKIIAFWRPGDPYAYMGQWYESEFQLNNEIISTLPKRITDLMLFKNKRVVIDMLANHVTFNSAEKFMMMGKAALFDDAKIFRIMAKCNDPKEQRRLGRHVTNFDEEMWTVYCNDIVKLGNYLKFSQNQTLGRQLLNTGNAMLVEGSPMDRIWGVGLKFDDPAILDKNKWRGTNYLGQCLEFVRGCL
jgi:ribA/ribD-fused uncharacterized protein